MDNLWEQVKDCFDTDDGSLPGIEIQKLSPAGVAAIYAMLRRRSQVVGTAEFWSLAKEASVPVDSLLNAAALVAVGEAEAFHHCIENLISADVKLPVLGVFVFNDTIELDYRMGRDWGPAEVAGLLRPRLGCGRCACL